MCVELKQQPQLSYLWLIDSLSSLFLFVGFVVDDDDDNFICFGVFFQYQHLKTNLVYKEDLNCGRLALDFP